MKPAIFRRLLALLLGVLLTAAIPMGALAAQSGAGKVDLTTPDASGNTPFTVTNMFPGDAYTRDFTVKVKHNQPITLFYHADIRPGSEKLAEVLMVTVEIPSRGLTLYSGLMRDMPNSLTLDLAAQEKEVVYRITAWLDTSVGNDYMYRSLVADFRWWYMEEALTPAAVKLAAEKLVDRSYARGSDFIFQLADENGAVVSTTRNKDGIVEFDTLTFTAPGTYIYYMSEQKGTDARMLYDDVVYEFIITVTEKDGILEAAVKCNLDGIRYPYLPRFVNRVTTRPGEHVTPDTPKTGDTLDPLPYLAGLVGAGVLLLILLLGKKRKKEAKA